MDINIKPLSPVLLNDYLNFFDNSAFADHCEWSGCYCVEPHICGEIWPELSKGVESKGRQYAIDFINSGKLQGYLAYCGDEVMGWCNANDKANYERIQAQAWRHTEEDGSKKIKSIMCFVISPAHRRQGIASWLLEHICEDAKSEGYDIVETYPYCVEQNDYDSYSGPLSMY